jgi:hypothetical protein
MKVHVVPGNKIRSEWVHVRSAGSLKWELLFLIQCDDKSLYFFQGWDEEPHLCIPVKEITQLVDCGEIKPKKHERVIRVEASALSNSDCTHKSRMPKALQVRISKWYAILNVS